MENTLLKGKLQCASFTSWWLKQPDPKWQICGFSSGPGGLRKTRASVCACREEVVVWPCSIGHAFSCPSPCLWQECMSLIAKTNKNKKKNMGQLHGVAVMHYSGAAKWHIMTMIWIPSLISLKYVGTHNAQDLMNQRTRGRGSWCGQTFW